MNDMDLLLITILSFSFGIVGLITTILQESWVLGTTTIILAIICTYTWRKMMKRSLPS